MFSPGFDDIIFEKRNKEYGAYFLRKGYNGALTKAIIATCAICFVFAVISLSRKPGQKEERYVYTSVDLTMENLAFPVDGAGAPPPGEPPPPATMGPSLEQVPGAPANESDIYSVPEIVDTVFLADMGLDLPADSLPGKDPNKGSSNGSGGISGVGTEGNAAGGGGGSGGGSGYGGYGYGGAGNFTPVEQMPEFKGGDIDKFREWVQKRTKYPEVAQVNNVHGKVYISFIVENDGSVTNVNVVKGVDPLIDEEAVKAVKSSPKWTPGKQKGVPIRFSYLIVLDFLL